MATQTAYDAAEAALMRDPRQNPYGYISRAATGPETFTSMFAWFPDLKSLTEYLRRIEPQIFDVGSCDPDANEDERQELDEFIEYMEPVVSAITLQGLTDELNIKYNEVAYPVSRIEWWGTFDALCNSPDPYPCTFRESFRACDVDDEDESQDCAKLQKPIESGELDSFVEYLQQYGY